MGAAGGLAVGLLLMSGAAHALFIDFETTPSGATPTDNMALAGSATYTDGSIEVAFGWDTNGDLAIDTDAYFEKRGTDAVASYITGDGIGINNDGPNDADYSTEFDGGDWLLRRPGGLSNSFNVRTSDFLIVYGGSVGTRSAAGQLWDLDNGEVWVVEAFASDLSTLLGSTTLSAAASGTSGCCAGPGDGTGQGDGRPSTFSFSGLSQDLGVIRISYTATGNPGFGFDNFNASEATIPTPAPATAALVVAGLAALGCRRRGRGPA